MFLSVVEDSIMLMVMYGIEKWILKKKIIYMYKIYISNFCENENGENIC